LRAYRWGRREGRSVLPGLHHFRPPSVQRRLSRPNAPAARKDSGPETETEAEAEAEVEVEVLEVEVEVEVEVEAEVEGEVAVLALAGLEGGSPPRRILEALARYAELHIQPGSFLTAVLENNLAEALLTADVDSLAALPEINRLIARHLPTPCYGSREKVAAWLGSERDELLRRANANTLRAYLDAEHDVGEAIGEARAGGTD
jgi:hypothetical protein